MAWGGVSLGTPHVGGALGEAGAKISDAWKDAGSAISGAWKDTIHPNNFSPNIDQNAFDPALINNGFNPQASVNSFQATNPEFAQTDFSGAMGSGLGGAQQGLGALGGTYAAQQALAQQGAQALGQQQNLYGQQQGLADALLAQSRGQGPNPAQMQLHQDTDRAIAQQASALASQRGINPALAARLASQQGGQMTQQMAGQAAVMGAQQQLAAQQALGQQQQAMGQNLLGQNATLANQGNLFNQAAGTAGTLGGLGANLYGTGVQGSQAQNQLLSNNSLATQGLNAGVAQQNAALNAQNTALQGGVAEQNANLAQQQQGLKAGVAAGNQAADIAGQQIKAGVAGSNASAQSGVVGGLLNAGGALGAAAMMPTPAAPVAKAHGGEIPDAKAMSLAQALMGQGGQIPGRGMKPGDAAANDTVPTVLSPKEIVLPRTVTMAEDAPEKAAEFVAKLKGKSSGAKGYGKILEKHREVQKRMADLEEIIRSQAG